MFEISPFESVQTPQFMQPINQVIYALPQWIGDTLDRPAD
jgi:hypothetical protein